MGPMAKPPEPPYQRMEDCEYQLPTQLLYLPTYVGAYITTVWTNTEGTITYNEVLQSMASCDTSSPQFQFR